MSNISNTIASLELAQIGWVVRDIEVAMKFLGTSIGIAGFPPPDRVWAQDIGLSYYGKTVESEWLTSQTYNGGTFIELVQPLSGKNMFQDYLDKHPLGGVQHIAYRLPIEGYDSVIADLQVQGYPIISEVDHPIARMTFFDTYEALGIVTEIMGITAAGWKAIEQMKK